MKKNYFLKGDGSYYLKRTKQEILESINNNDPNTFLPYLKDMDYPYIENEWNFKVKHYGEKDGNVFGRYIATMRLCAYRKFTYKDSFLFKREEEINFDFNN